MKTHLRIVLALGVAAQGCIIGTWPVPEERSTSQTDSPPPAGTALAPEACDGKDNDADGSVDEGCACQGQARGCVGIEAGLCGLGVQWCVDGFWAECADIGPPFTVVRPAQVRVVEVDPPSLIRGGEEHLVVRAIPEPPCPAIAVQEVRAALEATAPVMVIRAVALDDGVTPDRDATDGEFAASLPNAFGPGVPAQALTVRVVAAVGGEDVSAVAVVPLVDP